MGESNRIIFLASAPEVPDWFMHSEIAEIEGRKPTPGYSSRAEWDKWWHDRAEFHFYRIVEWRNAFANRMIASEYDGNPIPPFMHKAP